MMHTRFLVVAKTFCHCLSQVENISFEENCNSFNIISYINNIMSFSGDGARSVHFPLQSQREVARSNLKPRE